VMGRSGSGARRRPTHEAAAAPAIADGEVDRPPEPQRWANPDQGHRHPLHTSCYRKPFPEAIGVRRPRRSRATWGAPWRLAGEGPTTMSQTMEPRGVPDPVPKSSLGRYPNRPSAIDPQIARCRRLGLEGVVWTAARTVIFGGTHLQLRPFTTGRAKAETTNATLTPSDCPR
jgi:hypothetical protein